MKVLIIGGISRSLINFRGPLLRSLIARGHEVYACAGGGDLSAERELGSLGVRFHAAAVERRSMNVVSDWAYLMGLRRLLRQCHPDVVISYTIKPVIYGSLATCGMGVPVVAAMITGAGAAQPGRSCSERVIAWIARSLYAAALKNVSVIFFQNRDDEALFRQHKLIRRQRVIQIPGSGVDLIHFAERPPVTDPITFLLIARLLENKGIREYVGAARNLKRIFPGARFMLLGPEEPGRGGIRIKQVLAWHEEGAIEYLGSVDDVRPILASASVLVLPSYREGTPRTVLEAMSMGRPIITTDAPGCRDTVEDGVNGYLVPGRDIAVLEAKMKLFIDNRHLICVMGRRSRKLAEQRYDVRQVNQIIVSALEL